MQLVFEPSDLCRIVSIVELPLFKHSACVFPAGWAVVFDYFFYKHVKDIKKLAQNLVQVNFGLPLVLVWSHFSGVNIEWLGSYLCEIFLFLVTLYFKLDFSF